MTKFLHLRVNGTGGKLVTRAEAGTWMGRLDVATHGGATIAYDHDRVPRRYGVAVCSEMDQYDHRRGRLIASRRMETAALCVVQCNAGAVVVAPRIRSSPVSFRVLCAVLAVVREIEGRLLDRVVAEKGHALNFGEAFLARRERDSWTAYTPLGESDMGAAVVAARG